MDDCSSADRHRRKTRADTEKRQAEQGKKPTSWRSVGGKEAVVGAIPRSRMPKSGSFGQGTRDRRRRASVQKKPMDTRHHRFDSRDQEIAPTRVWLSVVRNQDTL